MTIQAAYSALTAALTVTLTFAMGTFLGGCASVVEPVGPVRKEAIFAVTTASALIKFNAGQPQKILESKAITGLGQGEHLVGIDFRVAKGVLFALSNLGRLYTLDTSSGSLKPVGTAPSAIALKGDLFGFDFNPVADRIRVVSPAGQSFRLHPETGAAVDADPNTAGVQADGALTYAKGDSHEGKQASLVAAAYTYNKKDEKITTNFAIDNRLGALVMQGSLEGVAPVVSPNTGLLRTVGSLGLGPFVDATFDIADISGAAFAAIRRDAGSATRLYELDLSSGQAKFIGTVGIATPLVGMAVEP
jgi:hypothetical protein